MSSLSKLSTAGLAVAGAALLAVPAEAKCTRLGFSVNDYGKDGPTKDAKDLLDKYVAKWAAEQGIAKYSIGKKDVKCELFLDFIVFDEHTCRAEASVCWDEKGAPAKPSVVSAKPEAAAETPAQKPAAKQAPKQSVANQKPAAAGAAITTGTIAKPVAAPAAAPEAAPVAAPIAAPAAAPPAAAPVAAPEAQPAAAAPAQAAQ